MAPRLEVDLAAVLGTTGITLVAMGAAQLLPALVALTAGQPPFPFVAGAVGTASVGLLLVPLRRRARKWSRRESAAIVIFSWLAAILAAAVPYVATGTAGVVDALVESASGLTTTGATVFPWVDTLSQSPAAALAAEATPHPLHLWRALTHWLGGAGIVLVVLVLAPWLGEEAETIRRTQRSEASFLTERYRGSTRATLKGLFAVYVGATVLLTLLLFALGVSAWDALLHAFSTIPTGGFSSRTASLGAWGAAVQMLVLAFMLLGALNFAVLGRAVDDLLWLWQRTARQASPVQASLRVAWSAFPTFARSLWRNGEVRGFLLMVLGVSFSLTALLFLSGVKDHATGAFDAGFYARHGVAGLAQAFVDASFTVGALATTTGFTSVDFSTWPAAGQLTLLALMVVGGCSGSTAGGVKFRRLQIVVKHAYREVRRLPRPRAVMPLKLGGVVVPEDQVKEAVGYLTTYVLLVGAIAIAVALTGPDAVSAGGASVSALGSIGPTFGAAGPAPLGEAPTGSFLPFSPGAKLLLILGMLLGRLEIFSVLTVLLPSFWFRRSAPR